MSITFDPKKSAKNIAERGLPFEWVERLEWNTAVAREDRRRDYGEKRVRVLALLGKRLHMAVITYRGDIMHVISFRKANQKEIKWYEEERR